MKRHATKNPRDGKRRLTGEERRAVIVEAAVSLFAERGFQGTTTRRLAAAAGVSEPVLYQHFATKHDLYYAIIESKSKQRQRQLKSLLKPYLQTSDDHAFFSRLAELILEPYATDWAYVRLLLFSALEQKEFAELYYERQLHCFYRMVGNYIEQRMRQRAFRKLDAYLAARSFVGMVSNAGMVSVLFSKPHLNPKREAVVEHLVNVFLDGIRMPRKEAR